MSEWFREFANTDLGKIIAIGCFALLCLVYLFTHTSIGRKSLKELKNRANNVDNTVKVNKESIDKELESFKEEIKNELLASEELKKQFEEFVVSALSKINNKKIKDTILEYKNKSVEQLTTNKENNAQNG